MCGLIIKGSINRLKAGYPTMGDKYDSHGGTLDQTSGSLAFGQAVKYTGTPGYYVAVDTDNQLSSAAELAGIRLAVNVKLVNSYPGNGPALTYPGEQFDLCPKGYIAVPVSFTFTNDNEGETTNRDAAFALMGPNKTVYITAAGVFTQTSASNIAIPAVFTGRMTNIVTSVGDTTTTVKCIAEINYNY